MSHADSNRAYLNRIGTSVPPNDVHRTFIDFAATLLPNDRMRRVFTRMEERSGIEHRYTTLRPADDPRAGSVDRDDFYRRGAFPHSGKRMAAYEAAALPLALQAITRLGADAHPERATHLIVTSCTGFYAPGLDLQLASALGMAASVERSCVGFMGCYAAFNALKLARHIVRSEPAARVLLVNIELCTLHLHETADLERMLSFLVFADGCAACLVTAEPEGLELERFWTALLPDTETLISWRIGGAGFDMVLSGAVPGAIATGLANGGHAMLGEQPLDDVGLWAVHPGGRSVLDAVQNALSLPPDALACSRSVLRDYGNMSSATILFVLERMMRETPRDTAGLAMGFGPGLIAESMRFRTL